MTNDPVGPDEPIKPDRVWNEPAGPPTVTTGVFDAARITGNVLLTLGLITGALGALMLFWPSATVRVVALLFGIWLILSGVVLLVQAVGSRASAALRVLFGLAGVVSVVLGGVAVVNSEASKTILVIFVVVGWLAHGIAFIIAGLRDRGAPDRGIMLAFGVVLILLALLVMAWPAATVTVLVRLIGLGLLLTAILEILASVRVRRTEAAARIVVIEQ